MNLLPVLRSLLGLAPAEHQSIKWDTVGNCQRAICSVCDAEVGVSTAGNLLRHGPLNQTPCPGTGGRTTFPKQGPGNAAASIRARNQAIAGRNRPRRKR